MNAKKIEEYRPIPFWSWNDKLEVDKLKKQMHWMKKNSIGGFFMHARSGLQTEYLSEEWMKCIEACADEAEQLGMKAWLYDENGWPSGFAGGKLLEKEENKDRFILYQIGAYDSEATVSYLLTEKTLCRVSHGNVNGEYLNLYIHISPCTADILNPDVVKQFIAHTHDVYKERFGEDFDKKIEGFFTDEPQYYRYHTPYTVMIAKYFKEKFDEDILDSLGLLFVEKEGYRRFRYRYWKGMQELMLESFAKQVYQWCEENHVKLTGHYIEETSLRWQMMCCGGVMPFYEYEHIPGIDWLGKETGVIGALAPKQLGSVAAQLGKKRVLTETFGCCGWDVTPTELKRIAGFQYINGVNMICQHLIPYSERGNRKYDFPAHYGEENPWIREEFQSFNEYFARLGCMLGESEQHVNVAVLHPIRSAYFDYKRENTDGMGISQLEKNSSSVCNMLAKQHVEYHFLDETLMRKYGFVDEATIGCGKCRYEYLILPHLLTMDQSTEKLLHQYVQNGGKVLILGNKPVYREAESYAYEYLTSTCTLDEIRSAQPYRVRNLETEVIATYRTFGEKQFLYVMNISDCKTYEQSFELGAEIHSFEKRNLLSGETEQVPLTIVLEPGEDAVLIPSSEVVTSSERLHTYQLVFRDTKVKWKENFLPIDHVSFSTDGVNFSRPWPHVALFEHLLRERYQGTIYFRYEFTVDIVPSDIRLQTETGKNDKKAWLNGIPLTAQMEADESYIGMYDISGMVQQGINEYVLETHWQENESVYYSLFGENVTEALRNCVVYDSELQPVILRGLFGVYPREPYVEDEDYRYVRGNHFYIGEIPGTVHGITTCGFPFFAGKMTMHADIQLETRDVLLDLPGEYLLAEVTVNGHFAGKLVYGKQLDISKVAVTGKNNIEVCFLMSNRNLMGPHHCKGSKESISNWSFELHNSWVEDVNPYYHDDYDIKLFYNERSISK